MDDHSFRKVILILSSNPTDIARLRLDEEQREIEASLRLSPRREQFELRKQPAIRVEDIHRSLLDTNPQIVHFCGHSYGTGGLAVEDANGKTQLISTEALANLFKLFRHQIECVVLNACYAEVQATAISQYIPYVVGMSQEIGSQASIQFAVGFYNALGAGRDYEEAYQFGCNLIELQGMEGHLAPVMLKREPSLILASGSVPHSKSQTSDSSYLAERQRNRILQEVNSLQQQSDLFNEKLSYLRNAIAIETDVANRFKLQKQIDQAEADFNKLAQRIETLENKL